MMRRGSRLTRYEYRDSRASTPSKACADTAAPPTWSRRSSTRTRRPARARYAAATRPLCPPPTMTTSDLAVERSAEVALDLVRRTHLSFPRVAAGLPQGPALPQQVPALVELHLEGFQPSPVLRTWVRLLLGCVDLAVLQLVPQFLFLGDQPLT